MKLVIIFLTVFVLSVTCGVTPIDDGPPTLNCPVGEHSVLYCPQKAEPNCDIPELHDRDFAACDIPDCFCNAPTVRDVSSGKCVKLNDCPKKC